MGAGVNLKASSQAQIDRLLSRHIEDNQSIYSSRKAVDDSTLSKNTNDNRSNKK
jgi:hypothetical protein